MTTEQTQPPAGVAAATSWPQFHDSSRWLEIPSGSSAALASDGIYAVPPADAARFGRVRWITVLGDYARSGAIDWEPGNPCFTAPALRRFVRGRRAMGKRARVYVDRADAAEAIAALYDYGRGELLSYPGLLWWITTLDSHPWTPEELAAELIKWDAPIPAGQIWANQNLTNGLYDTSSLFLPW